MKIVHREVKHIALEEREIESGVGLVGLLPCDIGVANACLVVSASGRRSAICRSEVIPVREYVSKASTRTELADIEEAVAANLVISDSSVRAPYLENLEPVGRMKPRLVTDDPAGGEGREHSVAPALREVLRAIITEIELGKIALSKVVGNTGAKTLIGIHILGAIEVLERAVTEQLRVNRVTAEVAVIVQAKVVVGVALDGRPCGGLKTTVGGIVLIDRLSGNSIRSPIPELLEVLPPHPLEAVGVLKTEICLSAEAFGNEVKVIFCRYGSVHHITATVVVAAAGDDSIRVVLIRYLKRGAGRERAVRVID